MLNKECLKQSPYEYLKSYYDKVYTPSRNGEIKGLAVLTDEQYIFYGKTEDNDLIHYDIAMDIEAALHPERPSITFIDANPHHSYIFLTGKEAAIELPECGEIHHNQVKFLTDFLQDMTKYNQEVTPSKRIPFEMREWNNIEIPPTYEIDDISEETRKELKDYLTFTTTSKKEKIIGKTLIAEEKEEIEAYVQENKGGKSL